MGALIGAYPYDVPAWLPEVLVLMVRGEGSVARAAVKDAQTGQELGAVT